MNQNKNIAVTPNSIVTEICKGVEKLKREEVFKNFPHQESLDNVYRNIFSNYYEDWNYKFIIDRGPWGCPPNLKFLKDYFNQDIKIVCHELDMKEPWWRNLDDTRQRVMANMCFNLGHPRLSNFKRFLAAMHTAQWETAAVEMMDSKWSSQVGDRALRLRDKVLRGDD